MAMCHLRKLKSQSFLKWVSLNFSGKYFRPSRSSFGETGYCYIAQNPKFDGTKAAVKPKIGDEVDDEEASKISPMRRREAQTALIEYLQSTRCLRYMDAEHISRNSPRFLMKLLKEVENEKKPEQSFTRSLRHHLLYQPINEFEPFFESMGLRPSEYALCMPRDMMFLSDDMVLLENYHALCASGVDRNKIGKIFKEANEVFRYDHWVLRSKIRSLQEAGFDKSSLIKLVTTCPRILIGCAGDFFQVLERLKCLGVGPEWVVEKLSEEMSYDWKYTLQILCLLSKLGFSNEQLEGLLRKHPEILLEGSGSTPIPLIGFLLKFGASANDIASMFLKLPEIPFQKFVSNLRHCYLLFVDIEMDFQDIAKLVCAYPVLLGSYTLKKTSSLLGVLMVGKKQLRKIIKESPQEIKNWAMGSKVKPLPRSTVKGMPRKPKLLSYLGFVGNSDEMKEAFRFSRAEGGKLEEKFDCLVNAGLNEKDVEEMIIRAPYIINQSKEALEMRINCLLSLGYPISALVAYPSFLTQNVEKIKLRVSMYNWLKDQGTVTDDLALSTIITISDNFFLKKVNRHPNGPEVWEKLKKHMPRKSQLLPYLGFVGNSDEMKEALRFSRAEGGKLQEKFDCLVNAGLNEKDVEEMVIRAPSVTKQSKEALEMRIDCLLSLGYPISALLAYPGFLTHAVRKVKLRVSMYNWLRDQGTVTDDDLALSSIITIPDRFFLKKVNRHPNGPEVWEKLKKQIYSE